MSNADHVSKSSNDDQVLSWPDRCDECGRNYCVCNMVGAEDDADMVNDGYMSDDERLCHQCLCGVTMCRCGLETEEPIQEDGYRSDDNRQPLPIIPVWYDEV